MVLRQMIGELRHDYAVQQSRTGVTALDGFWWLRSLNDTVAPAAGQFWALCFDNLKGAADKLQLRGCGRFPGLSGDKTCLLKKKKS